MSDVEEFRFQWFQAQDLNFNTRQFWLSLAFWCRSLSEFQESAQYLSGSDFVEAVLQSLLAKVTLSSKKVGVVNCTPYDCWLEKTCMEHPDSYYY